MPTNTRCHCVVLVFMWKKMASVENCINFIALLLDTLCTFFTVLYRLVCCQKSVCFGFMAAQLDGFFTDFLQDVLYSFVFCSSSMESMCREKLHVLWWEFYWVAQCVALLVIFNFMWIFGIFWIYGPLFIFGIFFKIQLKYLVVVFFAEFSSNFLWYMFSLLCAHQV